MKDNRGDLSIGEYWQPWLGAVFVVWGQGDYEQKTRPVQGHERHLVHRQVYFITAHHKDFQQSEQIKIIHRFMPPEVGKSLVWYKWLVLRYWQSV